MGNSSVGIIVVTFNRKELLKECLNDLLGSSYQDFHIYLVDNASTDGTKEYIESYLSNDKISYFNTGKNIGGAGGFNCGMKLAIKDSVDYLWLMDDDCMVKPDSLEVLMNKANELKDDFGFLSSKVLWKDGSHCLMNTQKKTLTRKVDLNGGFTTITAATFVSFFIRREVVEDIGLPIKEFFIWGDDIEYSHRISGKYASYYVPESVVIHKSKSNIGSDIALDDKDHLGRYHYAYRNEAYLYKRMGLKGRLFYFLKRIKHKLKIMKNSKDSKKERISIINKSTKEGFHFNPKIEYVFSSKHKTEVMICFCEPLAFGGQEAFMMNMYANFNNKNIHYTFVTPFEATNEKFIHMIKERGDDLIAMNYKFESKLRKHYIKKTMKKVLAEKDYDVIHIQTGSVFNLLIVSKMAKKRGVRKVIVHSHCAGFDNFKYRLIKKYSDKRIEKNADYFFACSQLAGEWKFPKRVLEGERYQVIDNGILTSEYTFNEEVRNKIRAELGLKDELTFLHVGRFAIMKNHAFFEKLLPLIEKKYPDFKFIFVGAGELKKDFQTKMKEFGFDSHIIYLENITNVNEVMMASDVFLFPSLFEGFPMTLVEAQASGLPTIYSDKITSECNLTDYIYQLPLDENEWMEKIEKVVRTLSQEKRSLGSKVIADKGYDASKSALVLEETYLGYGKQLCLNRKY